MITTLDKARQSPASWLAMARLTLFDILPATERRSRRCSKGRVHCCIVIRGRVGDGARIDGELRCCVPWAEDRELGHD